MMGELTRAPCLIQKYEGSENYGKYPGKFMITLGVCRTWSFLSECFWTEYQQHRDKLGFDTTFLFHFLSYLITIKYHPISITICKGNRFSIIEILNFNTGDTIANSIV